MLVQHIEQPPDAVARAIFTDAERKKIELILMIMPVLQIHRHRTLAVARHGLPLVENEDLNRHQRAVGPGTKPLRADRNLRAQIPLIR